ncbi:MAG: phosphoglucosamine mutase [Actinobacteria bacterium]|nr:phosphoglucosamine mutase [Actinomycetota bacterium]
MTKERKLFGTDGIRGIANRDLTAELTLKVGRAAAEFLVSDKSRKGRIIVGRDPRPSGDFIESAIIAGILSSGHNVLRAGIITTPAVALLTKVLNLDGGIVISASHNPLDDNGIKFFSKEGQKLTDEQEKLMEDYILGQEMLDNNKYPTGADVGRCFNMDDACEVYLNHVLKDLHLNLEGLRIAVDCANGSPSVVIPDALKRVGADVVSFNTNTSGEDINQNCGSTHPEALRRIVFESNADIGFSYDGDGDRVIACDGMGRILDGDVIMAFCALKMFEKGLLKNNCLVTTVMANMGLEKALKHYGITVYKTAVGDRYVLEKMAEVGAILGGEQSGHIIFKDLSPTGDGLVSTLRFLWLIVETGCEINEIHKIVRKYPQVLKNVPVKDKTKIMNSEFVKRSILDVENQLKGDGKVVVRPSGTEPVIRVMVEAKTEEIARSFVDKLSEIISRYHESN